MIYDIILYITCVFQYWVEVRGGEMRKTIRKKREGDESLPIRCPGYLSEVRRIELHAFHSLLQSCVLFLALSSTVGSHVWRIHDVWFFRNSVLVSRWGSHRLSIIRNSFKRDHILSWVNRYERTIVAWYGTWTLRYAESNTAVRRCGDTVVRDWAWDKIRYNGCFSL